MRKIEIPLIDYLLAPFIGFGVVLEILRVVIVGWSWNALLVPTGIMLFVLPLLRPRLEDRFVEWFVSRGRKKR